jgi:hypothetical protein
VAEALESRFEARTVQERPVTALGGALLELARRSRHLLRPKPLVERDLVAVHIELALEQPGCALCRLRREAEARWLWAFLWESVCDPGIRQSIRAAGGFCRAHWWGLCDTDRHEIGTTSGIAIVAEDLIGRALEQPVGAARACPTCASAAYAEATYIRWTALHLARAEFRDRLAASEGLCLAHLAAVLDRLNDAEQAGFLVSCHGQTV